MKKKLLKLKTLLSQDGFTLLETIMTAVVLAIGVVAVLMLFDTNNKLSSQAKNIQTATKFAQGQLDYYRSLGYSNLSTGTTDVTSSMPSGLSGTAASCTSGNARSACLIVLSAGSNPTSVDTTGGVGYYSSIATGSDGLPVVAYLDAGGSGSIKVTKCGNIACSTGNTITSVATPGNLPSIAVPSDGLPVISFWDQTSLVKFVKCGNAACSSGNTITTLDSGEYSSVAIGSDGLPVVSYSDASAHPKFAKCGNAACSSGNTLTVVDASSTVVAISMAVGSDGLPIFTYAPNFGSSLKVAKCGNAACSSGNTLTTLEASGVGGFVSIAVGTDGLATISYYYSATLDLKVAKCGNAACSSGNTLTTVDSTGSIGDNNSIAVPADGLPVVSYRDGLNIKLAKCGNAACSSGNTITTVDPISSGVGSSGQYTSISATDGLPVLSYFENGGSDLRVLKCGTSSCQNLGNAYSVIIIVKYLEGQRTKTVRMSEIIGKGGLGT